jgi:hypothetical protein
MKAYPENPCPHTVVGALILFLLMSGPAAAGEKCPGQTSALHQQNRKMVCLQLRIAEAKRTINSFRYYQSMARQQKIRELDIPTCRVRSN